MSDILISYSIEYCLSIVITILLNATNLFNLIYMSLSCL